MKKLILTLALASSTSFFLQAQDIFTYGKNGVSKKEFERAYTIKNAQSKDFKTLKGLNEYVDLYALFKMKVADAKEQGMDTLTTHKNDISQYKVQLSKSFLTDASVNDILLKEAYERSKSDVEIAHIQISVRGNDTAQSFARITNIYNDIKSGKLTYEEAAAKYSEDHASKNDGGNIGYISALDVFYPIENAAYTLPVGSYSEPIRTHVGYHIVKVLNKRASKGQVQVAQILVLANEKDPASVELAQSKADAYYKQLKAGADFTQMVKEHSEDKFSINNNGLLVPFGTGKMDIKFENAAFALKNVGDISQPVQTLFGFHILKLVKKIPIPTYEASKAELAARLKTDKRVEIAEKAMKERQLASLGYSENTEALNELVVAVNQDTARVPKVTVAQFESFKKPLFHLDKKAYTQKDFIEFVVDATNGNLYGRRDKTLRDLYRMYNDKMIQDVQIAKLESGNEEFKSTMMEYEEANLIFALMEKNIWSKALNDPMGLNDYYEAHKEKYKFKAGFGGNVFESSSKESLSKLKGMINEGVGVYDGLQSINEVASNGKITMQSGKYEYASLPAKVEGLTTNVPSDIYTADNGNYFMIVPDVVFGDNTQKTIDEARGLVITDYQASLEDQWAKNLRAKYPLKVNEKVVKSLVKK